MKRYIARYSGKEGFEERYEVIDTYSGASVSKPLPYHQANEGARTLNQEPDAAGYVYAPVAMIAPAFSAEEAEAILRQWQAGQMLIPISTSLPELQITPIYHEPDNG